MGTTRIPEDEVAQDVSLPTAGGYPGNSLDDHDKASPAVLDKYAGDPPDGGAKAWSVILGASLATFASFGYINTWGLYQDYYEHVLLPGSGPSAIAWIGSIQYAFMLILGLFIGRLFDLGYLKLPYFIASCLLLTCVFLTAECTKYWQFFLAQGLGGGLASGILFGPAMGVVRHWFSKRSGLALGVIAVGSSIGGIVFPIVGQNLIPLIGFKWTVRVFGFILLIALGIATIAIDRRLPPVNVLGGLFNWTAFRNPAYTVYCIAGIVCLLGLYTVMTYLSAFATEVGVTNEFAFYLVAIANASSVVGRLCVGWLADRVGPLNVMIPFTTAAGVITLVWSFATNESSLIAISVVYGITYGAYVSLVIGPVFAMGEVGDVGRRTGMFITVTALGVLTGLPISGAINARTGGFKYVGYYAGGVIIFSVLLFIIVRHLQLGRLSGKV